MEDTLTTSGIARILEILADGHWHGLEEVRQKARLNKKQTDQIVVFLGEYNFIIVDETSKKIKLEETVREFLTQAATS